jgi:hypothetical protein
VGFIKGQTLSSLTPNLSEIMDFTEKKKIGINLKFILAKPYGGMHGWCRY